MIFIKKRESIFITKTYKKFGGSSISTTDAENFNKYFTF